MTVVSEAVVGRAVVCPLLQCRVLYLDGYPTRSADEMVMVFRSSAEAIGGLAARGSKHVDPFVPR